MRKLFVFIILSIFLAGSSLLPPINLTPTHPYFWALTTKNGIYNYVAKQFRRVSNNSLYWIWSGPYDVNRSVEMCDADITGNTCSPLGVWEWEQWFDINGQSGRVLQFGGKNPSLSTYWYGSLSDCEQSTNPGVIWPDLPTNQIYSYVYTWRDKDLGLGVNCSPFYIGAIRIPVENQQFFCGGLFNPDNYTWILCAKEERIDLVYNVYGEIGVGAGCEFVVYVSGNPKPTINDKNSSLAVRKWFRNGELRSSSYAPINGIPPNPDDANFVDWWSNKCQFKYSEVENSIYTGKYKLNGNVYQDFAP